MWPNSPSIRSSPRLDDRVEADSNRDSYCTVATSSRFEVVHPDDGRCSGGSSNLGPVSAKLDDGPHSSGICRVPYPQVDDVDAIAAFAVLQLVDLAEQIGAAGRGLAVQIRYLQSRPSQGLVVGSLIAPGFLASPNRIRRAAVRNGTADPTPVAIRRSTCTVPDFNYTELTAGDASRLGLDLHAGSLDTRYSQSAPDFARFPVGVRSILSLATRTLRPIP